MRALLDLLRENEAAAQDLAAPFDTVLREATSNLKILASEVGDKELIKEVAVEQAKLRIGIPCP